MIKKVIVIGYQPLTDKVVKDFYFSILNDNGFQVEYWDLSMIYFPNVLHDRVVDKRIIKISDKNELVLKLDACQIKECFFVLHITYEYRVLDLFRLLTKYDCTISFFARGALPVSNRESTWVEKILKTLNLRTLAGFFKNKYAGLLKRIGYIKPYDIVFSAGNFGYLTVGIAADIEKQQSKIIAINSHDYDTALENLSETPIIEGKFCLFLDEYLPLHPDFKLLGIKSVDADEYYATLNRFFDVIEEKYQLQIVIAAHPKAEMYKSKNPFNGRKVVFGKTSQLTRDCEFVLAHISTSQSFAVLNKKPVITLTTEAIKKVMPQYDHFIAHFSVKLNSSFINIDHYSSSDVKIDKVDEQIYNAYLYDYLTSAESERTRTSEIFMKILKEYHGG
ncbi:hypothetical protein D3C81_866020 [compost metagenome]|uniref:Uncharacterized protein n=1 Tax=Sphingobacterium paramultivorum TaxID=2886510 RepID=A0A7G5E720_9SPHI|nr:hypothetical protein [Sphingobacterium paramultivorum]QMV69795.1 hypothetical protein HS960_20005 [Sphingobacterium paramultivorum]WSO13622.1 hypothetical protein VUL84_20005 [Sphingobacterium paramultivorum]